MAIRFEFIKEIVVNLIKDHRIENAPIDIEKIAEHYAEIRSEELEDDNMSGMLYRHSENKNIIGINSRHPESRRRFTLAHELGHLLLHKNDEILIDGNLHTAFAFRNQKSKEGIDEKEIEANFFAASILMPESLLKKDAKSVAMTSDAEDAIILLADLYNVSVQAMTIRLTKLKLIDLF